MLEIHDESQQPDYLQRAVKTLSQRTKTLLSPWMQRRVDDLRARNRGVAESTRPLMVSQRNTQLLLRRVQQTRDHSIVWKPDIGALKPDLVERFSSSIAGRAQTLRLVGIRRRPIAPATAWESNLELTLPVGSASPAGQVIERIPPGGVVQGPSIFAAGQPIEPFKPTAPIPARSPRPTASPKATRRPAQKQLPPQARLYARVEEIAPHDETPGRETRKPLAAQVTPRETPQPARESSTMQRTPTQSFSLPEATTLPSVAAPSVAQKLRQTEPAPPTTSPEIPGVTPRRPRPTPSLPVQRVDVSDKVLVTQKPIPATPSAAVLPEITPPRPATEMPLAANQPVSVEPASPLTSQSITAPNIQRTMGTSTPRAEQPRPQPSVEAPAATKPVSPAEPTTRLPRVIAEPPMTEQPAQVRPPRALPLESPTQIAEPVQRATTPTISRAVVEPGARPRPEPPTAPQAPRRVITPLRPVETTQTPRLPTTPRPEERPTMPGFPRRVAIQRATEPATAQTASPESADAQPSPVAAPPESHRAVTPSTVNLAASATLVTPPDESIQTPPTPISTSPAAEEPSREETVLPLRQIIRRRADLWSHGLLRKPLSPPTQRPIARIQPLRESRISNLESQSEKMHARPTTDETKHPLSTNVTSPTLYARSPNLYIGPGPAPTVIRTGTLPQAQKRAHGDSPRSHPPMDLRTAMGAPPSQEEPLILSLPPQPTPVMAPAKSSIQPPRPAAAPPENAKRPVEMPLVRQQAAQAPVQTPRVTARVAEPVTRPSVVGELIQREPAIQRVEEESAAPESIDLATLARRVYPFVKRLVAIERERGAR